MGDSFQAPGSRRTSEMKSVISSKEVYGKSLVASTPKPSPLRHIASLGHDKMGWGTAGHVASFLLKVAALETVRRFSRAKCPSIWSGVQFSQVLCYPPFKWIQRWAPFKEIVRSMQILSRPLLVISIATTFSEISNYSNVTSDDNDNSPDSSDSSAFSELHSGIPSLQAPSDTRILDEPSQNLSLKSWMLQLYAELENLGISLPERINEDELQRFYDAANGDFSCFLSSVKKTIRWRESYDIISGQELEMWSSMVFWHGVDVKRQPCLIVRLGLGCTTLESHDRPRFAQAIVSQVEYGVLHLLDSKNPQITVILDCEGLSPLRFPMQVMRSCSSVLQNHFPNRLGCLFVIRLPPAVRVIAQTFVQVLKPVTREKLKIEGEMYRKVLAEYVERLPSYLGGSCTCPRCSDLIRRRPPLEEVDTDDSYNANSDEDLASTSYPADVHMMNGNNCDHVLRIAVVGFLIFWLLIAFIGGIYDP